MRYSIMLQIVVMTTLILVGSGAFFAWLQNRPQLDPFEDSQTTILPGSSLLVRILGSVGVATTTQNLYINTTTYYRS